MTIVVVNNNEFQLNEFMQQLHRANPSFDIILYKDPLLSAKYICNHSVDLVFAEAKMRPVDGISLLKVLRGQKPELPIAITSDSEAYRDFSMQAKADDYFIRPLCEEDFEKIEQIFCK